MNIGWNYKREHLHPLKGHIRYLEIWRPTKCCSIRSINLVLFKRCKYDGIMKMYNDANNIAEGAAKMTDTKFSQKFLVLHGLDILIK